MLKWILLGIVVIYAIAAAIYDAWWKQNALTDTSDHMGAFDSYPRTLAGYILAKRRVNK